MSFRLPNAWPMTNLFGLSALVWVVLTFGIAPVAASRFSWRAPPEEERQPLQAYPHDGSPGRSLKDVTTNSSSTACTYIADTSSHCIGAVDLCILDDGMGEHFRRACQTTCQICRVRRAPVIESGLILRPVVPVRILFNLDLDCVELTFRLVDTFWTSLTSFRP